LVFIDPKGAVPQDRQAASRIADLWGGVRPFPKPPAVDPRIGRVRALMHGTMHRKLPLRELAGPTGLSVSRLCHLFRSQVGTSPRRYLKLARLARAKELLETSTFSVKEVAARAGFNHVGRFIGHFRNTYGLTPSQHRRTVLRSELTSDDGH
jgi:transcriptional regulator GlxA family with amidase domain